MLFSSPTFLFLFLPIVLVVYMIVGQRNGWLLLASLFFYAWGEGIYSLVLPLSILMNYGFGQWVSRLRGESRLKWVVGLAVCANFLLLGVFKYTNDIVETHNQVAALLGLSGLPASAVHLPIGLSFITFQALTYVMDVARRRSKAQRNLVHVALFISMFPQLILGPIIRYRTVAAQIRNRRTTRQDLAEGVSRFVMGLGKKVLIADTLAVPIDYIFALPVHEVNAGVAWLATIGFTVQLYFDFSGYSDMAIGLGRMFGFRFRENFRYPYFSTSRGEFFQRWHISFFTWIRDYLYSPLVGKAPSETRQNAAILLSLTLAGLWHGSRWTYISWGVYNGVLIVVERLGFGRWLRTWWRPLRHGYVIATSIFSALLFRAVSLGQVSVFLRAMAGVGVVKAFSQPAIVFLSGATVPALLAGVIGCAPVVPAVLQWRAGLAARRPGANPTLTEHVCDVSGALWLAGVLVASLMAISARTYHPFIYFQF